MAKMIKNVLAGFRYTLNDEVEVEFENGEKIVLETTRTRNAGKLWIHDVLAHRLVFDAIRNPKREGKTLSVECRLSGTKRWVKMTDTWDDPDTTFFNDTYFERFQKNMRTAVYFGLYAYALVNPICFVPGYGVIVAVPGHEVIGESKWELVYVSFKQRMSWRMETLTAEFQTKGTMLELVESLKTWIETKRKWNPADVEYVYTECVAWQWEQRAAEQ